MNKFYGPPEDFKTAITSLNLPGRWEEFPEGARFKTINGGIIQWYSSTGSILVQGTPSAKKQILALLETVSLSDFIEDKNRVVYPSPEVNDLRRIFLVHGHDIASKEQMELMLLKLGLEPFVLANTSGGGLTIIEALEAQIGKNGAANFGIVLLTPDDFGYSKSEGQENTRPRARQNVVLEMGMLIAAIGRKNTVILKKGDLEIPSDANGILYLEFKEHIREVCYKLLERLRSSGFEIDARKAERALY
ncbi:TIR domain-containing protein [Parasegetibacter sp. NRK P23]|uniref:TIR domain-containing protein n=1 Tax=Parasegetibacter sp. NRK P23 TaxID=2942999 RepID=UPI002043D7B8|nr:nucleotide-binding protein [Parasegetibacter sp. NRK P23]MCM5530534.1 nucleotide-binding protein [Parasegetibacter sp. NRK P23]